MSKNQELKVSQPKPFLTEVKIKARVKEIAAEINHDYFGKEITFVCILKGSFIFFSDLIRGIEVPMTCEFLGLSSYGNQTVSSGEVKVTLDINEPLEGKHVIIVEDIIDSGLTLKYLLKAFEARKPASLKTCALLVKEDAHRQGLEADYSGFQIGSEFVVGYGLDYAEKFRGLPYIGTIENEH